MKEDALPAPTTVWSISCSCLVMSFLLSASSASAQGRALQIAVGYEPMPETVRLDSHYEVPIFVAAEQALTPTGQVNRDLFRPHTAEMIADYLRRASEQGCVRIRDAGEPADQAPPGRTGLRSALDGADMVVVAEVSGLRPGFDLTRAGTLVRVETREVLKGSPAFQTKYVFFPKGQLTLGDRNICKSNDEWAELPEVGDRVLLLLKDGWYNEVSEIVGSGATSVFSLPKGRALSLPRFYSQARHLQRIETSDDLLQHVRDKLSGGEEE